MIRSVTQNPEYDLNREICDPLHSFSLDMLFEGKIQSQKFLIILICPVEVQPMFFFFYSG